MDDESPVDEVIAFLQSQDMTEDSVVGVWELDEAAAIPLTVHEEPVVRSVNRWVKAGG
jgi:hypothetical protein